MANILLFFMSGYPPKNFKENYYQYRTGRPVQANHTNMGPARALIAYLEGDEEGCAPRTLDKVVYLASETVRANEGNLKFEQDLKAWISEGQYKSNVLFGSKNVPDNFEDNEIMAEVIDMTRGIEKNDHVYIDFSGGLRQAASALLAIARILEFKGVEKITILTNQFNPGSDYTEDNPLIVRENSAVFGAVDYVSATKYFLRTGDIRELETWFCENEASFRPGGKPVPEEEEILRTFKEFYGGISLCQAEKTLENWECITSALEKYNECPAECQTVTFRYVVELFKSTMRKDSEREESVVSLIRWCLRHDLMQQALTIFNEKMPLVVGFKNKNRFFLEWPGQLSEEQKKSYYLIYLNMLEVTGLKECEDVSEREMLKPCKALKRCVDLERCVDFKRRYLLLDAMRDHVNHASVRENSGEVDLFLAEIGATKTIQQMLTDLSFVTEQIEQVLDEIELYRQAFGCQQ